MINTNWPRWIVASISDHFQNQLGSSLPLYIEGEYRDTRELDDYAELRIDGPYIEKQHGRYRLYVEINVLVQSAIDNADTHRIHRDVGIVAVALTDCIACFKYGDGNDDDDSSLGSLKRLEDVKIHHFGQRHPEKAILQSTAEAHYEMFLS